MPPSGGGERTRIYGNGKLSQQRINWICGMSWLNKQREYTDEEQAEDAMSELPVKWCSIHGLLTFLGVHFQWFVVLELPGKYHQ